jgi:hypothetical protein
VTPGAASGESTTAGAAFPIRVAVTVTDKDKNPVAGVTVTFVAPKQDVTGRFGKRRKVRVTTDENGVAVASALTAGITPGGFVVVARVRGASHPAAFALVVRPRT